MAVEAGDAVFGKEPKKALQIVLNAQYNVAGQAFVHGISFEFWCFTQFKLGAQFIQPAAEGTEPAISRVIHIDAMDIVDS